MPRFFRHKERSWTEWDEKRQRVDEAMPCNGCGRTAGCNCHDPGGDLEWHLERRARELGLTLDQYYAMEDAELEKLSDAYEKWRWETDDDIDDE